MAKEKKIDEIKRLCNEKGLNVYDVFREAKIPTATIQNWKTKQPDTFNTYDTIIETIAKMKVPVKIVQNKTVDLETVTVLMCKNDQNKLCRCNTAWCSALE